MLARWVTLLVWALVAASAAAWGLKVFVQAPPAPPQTRVAGSGEVPRGDLTRLFGVDAAPPVAAAAAVPVEDARFKLVGVVSPRSPRAAREGVALISVDDKPARAYRVGKPVDGSIVLQGVDARGATLGPAGGAATIALRLPPPTPAATGTLPSALVRAPGAPPVPVPVPVPMTPGAFAAPQPGAQPLMPRSPGGMPGLVPGMPQRVLPAETSEDEGGGDEAPSPPVGGRPALR